MWPLHCLTLCVVLWALNLLRLLLLFVWQLITTLRLSCVRWTCQIIIYFVAFLEDFLHFDSGIYHQLPIISLLLGLYMDIQVINIIIIGSLSHWLQLLVHLTSLTSITMGYFILTSLLLLCDPRLKDQPIAICTAHTDGLHSSYILQTPRHLKFLGTRVAYYSNATSALQLDILTSGDVNPNPGQEVCVNKTITESRLP